MVKKDFKWDRVLRHLLHIEEKFKYGVSDKLLLAVSSSSDLLKINTPYYKIIFENLIEFEVKRIVRDTYFLATEDVFLAVSTNSDISDIRRKFRFEDFNDIFNKLIRKLINERFVFLSQSGRLLRSTRKLIQTIYPRNQLDVEQKVLRYIKDIIRYMRTPYRRDIEYQALLYAERVRSHPLLHVKEPLRKAGYVSFLG